MSATEAFFDTNVLLYLLSGDAAKADRAEALVAAGGVISVQVLNEFAAVALRKLAIPLADVREILSVVRGVCAIRSLDVATHDLGLDLAGRHCLHLYDGMIVAAALQAGCTVLYSEDMQHGRRFAGLRIENPF